MNLPEIVESESVNIENKRTGPKNNWLKLHRFITVT